VWEVPSFSVLFESVNGREVQPASVDAAATNNVPPRIQADFLFAAMGIPISLEIHEKKILPSLSDALEHAIVAL
jgi:hypothetical protein